MQPAYSSSLDPVVAAQLFFREPKRGGKKGQSNGKMAYRLNCLSRGDWGSLLSQLQADKAAAAGRQTVRKRRERDDPVTSAAKLRKTILSMLARGQVGRICSNEVASLEDPAVREALQAKYKARIKDLPGSVTNGECVHHWVG